MRIPHAVRSWLLLTLVVVAVDALYKEERFVYKNVTMSMPATFNITLTKVATVPRTLSMGVACEVPDFQIPATSKRFLWLLPVLASNAQKAQQNEVGCDVEYCDNGGMAGDANLCPPANKRSLMSAECTYKRGLEILRATNEAADAALIGTTKVLAGTINELVGQVAKGMEQLVDEMKDAYNTTLSKIEADTIATAKAMVSGFAEQTRITFDRIVADTNQKVGQIRDANDRRARELTQATLAAVEKSKQEADTLANMLRGINDMLVQGSNSFVDGFDSLIDQSNAAYMAMRRLIEEYERSIATLSVKVASLMLHESQGDDISNLLEYWRRMNKTDIIVGESVGNYSYTARTLAVFNNASMGPADHADGMVGKTLYECYEQGDYDLEVEEVDEYTCYEKGAPRNVLPYYIARHFASNYPSDVTRVRVSNIRGIPGKWLYINGRYQTPCSSTCGRNSWSVSVLGKGGVLTGAVTEISCNCTNVVQCSFDCVSWFTPDLFTFNDYLHWDSYDCRLNNVPIGIPCILYTMGYDYTHLDGGLKWHDGRSVKYLSAVGTSPTVMPALSKMVIRDIFGEDYYDIHNWPSAVPILDEVVLTSGNHVYDVVDGTTYEYHRCSKTNTVSVYTDPLASLYYHIDMQAYRIPSTPRQPLQMYADRGEPIYLATKDGLLDNVTPTMEVSPDIYVKEPKQLQYGTGNFHLQHPTRGNVRIHKCRRATTTANVTTDASSRILSAAPGIGPVAARVNGLPSVERVFIVSSVNESSRDMQPEHLVYTHEAWCCDDRGYPTVLHPNCATNGMSVCPNATLGVCGGNYTRLTGGNCTDGTQPTSVTIGYVSPRVYYCGQIGKHTSVNRFGIEPCRVKTLDLPGAGAEIETNVISPEGLYPAKCLRWSVGYKKVGLYTIHINNTDTAIPTMINNLEGKPIVFGIDDDGVVDEMDQLMGVGNGGYDCVRYEMDLFLHRPRACRNYEIPVYPTSTYFSGKVRSSGLSSFADYFSTQLVDTSDREIRLSLTLRDGIDYESAYISSVDLCPRIQVTYNDAGTQCGLTGWKPPPAGLRYEYNGVNVCSGGVCNGGLTTPDNNTIIIDMVRSEIRTNCYKFICMASRRAFLAYPTESFFSGMERSYKLEALSKQAGYDYGSDMVAFFDQLEAKLNETVAGVHITDIDTYFEANITMSLVTPDLEAVAAAISEAADRARNNIENISEDSKERLRAIAANTTQVLDKQMDEMLTAALAALKKLADEFEAKFGVNINRMPASMTDWIDELVEQEKQKLIGLGVSAGVLLASIAALVVAWKSRPK